LHAWFGRHVPASASWLQSCGARQFELPVSQTSPPAHVLEEHGQPMTSFEHVWHTWVPSQYDVPSQAVPPSARQGQLLAPSTQVLGTHTEEAHVRPALQLPVPVQGQPWSPAGHDSHRPASQRSPGSQVPLARHTQAAAPRLQLVQVPLTHSPTVHAPALHAQPTRPSQPASGVPESVLAGVGLQLHPLNAESATTTSPVPSFFMFIRRS
jgi:hypothetical protein